MGDQKNEPVSQPRLHDADPEKLMQWWASLDSNRGDRARLSRAESPEDVLMTPAFHHFLHVMPERWATRDHLYPSAMVAALLSHIRTASQKHSFAASLAQASLTTVWPEPLWQAMAGHGEPW